MNIAAHWTSYKRALHYPDTKQVLVRVHDLHPLFVTRIIVYHLYVLLYCCIIADHSAALKQRTRGEKNMGANGAPLKTIHGQLQATSLKLANVKNASDARYKRILCPWYVQQ